jgi:hypothetical protein
LDQVLQSDESSLCLAYAEHAALNEWGKQGTSGKI